MENRFRQFRGYLPILLMRGPLRHHEIAASIMARFPNLCDSEPCSHLKTTSVSPEWDHDLRNVEQYLSRQSVVRLAGDQWQLLPKHVQRFEVVRKLVLELVRVSDNEELIPYGDLSRVIGLVHHRPLRNYLEYLRDQVLEPFGMPLLTALVVNADSKLPGNAFLPAAHPDAGRVATDEEFKKIREAVYKFNWQQLLDDIPHVSSSVTEPRNRPWNRNELILALNLYLRFRKSSLGKTNPEILDLSQIINRNTNAVYMKLMNFRRLDPEYTGQGKVGLTRGNKEDESVWNDFSGDPEGLIKAVAAARVALEETADMTPDNDDQRHYWIEQYWPSVQRDPDDLFVWFSEGKQSKSEKMHPGDRVLFYEQEIHPDRPKEKMGAKTLFAAATITRGDPIYIPPDEQIRGKKRWIFKRRVKTDFYVPPKFGVPLNRIREIWGKQGWPRQGFSLGDKTLYESLEQEVLERSLRYTENQPKVGRPPSEEDKPYDPKLMPRFKTSGTIPDPERKLLRLEKADHAHRLVLNKLDEYLKAKGHKTSCNTQVDLFSNFNGDEWIYEVKSATESNYLSQVRHGIAQLYEYRYSYREDNNAAKLCLVMQSSPPQGLWWLVDYLATSRKIHLAWLSSEGFFFSAGGKYGNG